MRYPKGSDRRRWMMEGELVPQDRRAFLRRLGKTLAVGLGFGLITSGSASARTDVCGIWCSDMGQGGCPSGQTSHHCISSPCGYDYWECSAPGSYCACNGCC
jgi:hypothetical protein